MEIDTEVALLSLPVELVVQIARELNPDALRRLSATCRTMHNLLTEHRNLLAYDSLRLFLTIDYIISFQLSDVDGEDIEMNKRVHCGQSVYNGHVYFDRDLLDRIVAKPFRNCVLIEISEFRIDATRLSDFKFLLMQFKEVKFSCCIIKAFPDFETDSLEYTYCNFPEELHIPSTFSSKCFSINNKYQKPPPPIEVSNAIWTELAALENSSGLSSNHIVVRDRAMIDFLRQRQPRLEIVSFALTDDFVQFAAGVASRHSRFVCPEKDFGESPLTSLGVRKFINQLMKGPPEEQHSSFEVHPSNFYREHLLEQEFDAAIRLPKESLTPQANNEERFNFERSDLFDVVAVTTVEEYEDIRVNIFLTKRCAQLKVRRKEKIEVESQKRRKLDVES